MKKLSHQLLSLLFASLLCASYSYSQDDFANVEITTTHVAGNIYMLMGQGGNIAVSVGEDGVLMVDDQFAPLAGKIKAAIADLGGNAPTFLLNTHWHGDHSGGNELFADQATIIAHENVRIRMANPASGRVPESWPVITFEDSMSIFFNGEEIKLIHLPNGHTDGDTAIWFTESNVLHMGDQFFAIRYPFVDLGSGGTVVGLIRNLQNVRAMIPRDISIIPGHGELSDYNGFSTYVDGVVDTAGIVTSLIFSGLGLEDIQAEGLPSEYSGWGAGFISEDAWINAIYTSATR